MDEKHDCPVSRDDLLFTVEMALRKASRLWPKKRVPGDHDRLRPVAESVIAHFELCGLRVVGRPKARGHSTPDPHGTHGQSGAEAGEGAPPTVREDPSP